MEIEKGIPIPKQKRNAKWVKVVGSMEVGDSILINGKDSQSHECRCLRQAGKYLGFKMSARTFCEGVRLWRVQ
jgi:hypothetical protein